MQCIRAYNGHLELKGLTEGKERAAPSAEWELQLVLFCFKGSNWKDFKTQKSKANAEQKPEFCSKQRHLVNKEINILRFQNLIRKENLINLSMTKQSYRFSFAQMAEKVRDGKRREDPGMERQQLKYMTANINGQIQVINITKSNSEKEKSYKKKMQKRSTKTEMRRKKMKHSRDTQRASLLHAMNAAKCQWTKCQWTVF